MRKSVVVSLKTITLPDGRALSYKLTRKNVKNINFRAKEDGIVYVSANSRASVAQIEKYLIERADFFLKAFERLKEREERSEINASSVNWLGRAYPVRTVQNFRECAVIDENEIRVFTSMTDDPEYVLELVQKAVVKRFCELCGELDREVRAKLMQSGFAPPPTQITVKDMNTRWGSCSYTRGRISINIRLAAYPRETVLSVLWHEYAHYWHHDHSRNFYGFLLKFFPEYYKWNDLLKK